ncbi:MAG: S26 family signal peptidase [Clostridia bacterium]|nr:S26 family signal peptidase [Clostridia bacterium]
MSENREINDILAQIEEKGKAYFYTKGVSMLPTLKEGRDISVLAPLTREIKRGDVVLFTRKGEPDRLVLHRVIKRRRDGIYLIRGDNTYRNEPVKEKNVLALLEGFFRKGRYFDCEKSKRYRIYSSLWMFFYPFRKAFYFLPRRAAAKIKHALFG